MWGNYGNHSDSPSKIDDLREYVAGALYEDPTLGAAYEKVAGREGEKNVTSDMLIQEGVPAKLAKIWANEPVSEEYIRDNKDAGNEYLKSGNVAKADSLSEDNSEITAYKEDVKRNPEKYLPERYGDRMRRGTEAYLEMMREELKKQEASGDMEAAKSTRERIDWGIANQKLENKVREILLKNFEKGTIRPVIDSDWDKWKTAYGYPNVRPPQEGAIFVEDVEGVNMPPLCGSDTIDFILSDKIDIYKESRRFFGWRGESCHARLYGWAKNGTEPVVVDSSVMRRRGYV